ncbi:MAG: tetratricopeptide repeat protein [Spirochaetaceae bacterium]|jgi:putative GTP pyrophosphokinase|nr:tetratricopeptide repeat protein [Spirochaetaceae bacterium]
MDENNLFPDKKKLQDDYEKYAGARLRITRKLELRIEEALKFLPSHVLVKARHKDFQSYYRKYLKLLRQQNPAFSREDTRGEYPANPATEAAGGTVKITDLIGIRVVCPFMEELSLAEDALKKNFDVIEVDRKGSDQTFREFGYQSIHLLITIPDDIKERYGDPGCDAAEIQVRTILQDAWAEVEHEIVYKAEFNPFDEPMKRKLAAVNASLALADTIFQEIRSYQRQLNGELEKRRGSFYKKVEEFTDTLIFSDDAGSGQLPEVEFASSIDIAGKSIDDLLLMALSAHNSSRFLEAVNLYSRILDMDPNPTITSLIYKHRGMANFAQSQYQDAIDDFTKALELDGQSYKAAYYRGIVESVLQRYQAAIEDFTLSLSIHPYQSFCHFRRAQSYYHIEDYTAALADCETALSLWPGSPVAPTMKKFRSLLLGKLKM